VPPEHKALLAQLARKVQQGCKDRPEPKVLLERKALRGLREPLVFKEAPELLAHKALLAQLELKGQQVCRGQQVRKALQVPRAQKGRQGLKVLVALLVQRAQRDQAQRAQRELVLLEPQELVPLDQQEHKGALVQLDWAPQAQLAIKVKLEALAQLVKLVQRGSNLQSSLAPR
jgi:hypothetical protein